MEDDRAAALGSGPGHRPSDNAGLVDRRSCLLLTRVQDVALAFYRDTIGLAGRRGENPGLRAAVLEPESSAT